MKAMERSDSEALLVVDDDAGVREALELALTLDGFRVYTAGNGSEALRALKEGRIDLVLLDVMLPGSDGYSVLREIRSNPELDNAVPVLMLTARDEIEDRVRGLKGGADDYLIKPYAHRELVARIEALLRRARAGDEEAFLRSGSLRLDPARLKAWRDGVPLELTPKAFRLLKVFVQNEGRVLSKAALMASVWGEQVDPNTLEVHLSTLRRALGDPPLIRTVRGYGYVFRSDAA
jgi:two-component system response regulator MprA